ncbi:MAG: T9SS type A sorting domain-containing protein [Chloroflexota bacterium]
MKKYIILILSLIFAYSGAIASGKPWTFLSITPAPVTALEKYNHLFMIGASNAGCYYSDDYGIYWKTRSPNPNVGNVVGSVHFNSKIIFLGTSKASYSYTLDQWIGIPTLNGSNWNRIKVSGDRVYVAGGYQYFMYSADGAKFTRLNLNTGGAFTRDIEDFGSLLIATLGDNFLYRSTDAGATWNKFGDTIPGKKNRLYKFYNRLMLTLSPTGVYESLDSGATWRKVSYFDGEAIASAEFDDDIIYFAGANRGVHISADSGYNWMQWNEGLYNANTNFVRKLGNTLYAGLSMVNTHGVVDRYFYSTVVDFDTPLDIGIESVGKTRLCQGDTMSVFFKILSWDRDSSDIITLVLSDSSGDLSRPIYIDSLVHSGLLNFKFTASRDFPPSEKYYLMVKSYSPHRKPQMNPDTIKISIFANPKASMPELPSICNFDERALLTAGQPAGGYYKGKGVEDSVYFNPRNVIPGEHKITYYTVNAEGCQDSATNIIKVFYAPPKPKIAVSGDSLISNMDYGNQWYRDSVMIEGETGKILDTKNIEGYYNVRVSDEKCRSLMSDPVFVKDKALADGPNAGFKIYPNPASEKAKIYFESDGAAGATIRVFNSMGEELIRLHTQPGDPGNEAEIDLGSLPEGIYLVNIVSGSMAKTLKLSVTR